MELNEIKKILYKEKPIANYKGVVHINDVDYVLYSTNTSLGVVWFKIPTIESGNFDLKESAQLLIRWIEEEKEDSPYASWWIDPTGDRKYFYTKQDYLQRFN